jgi:predicted  nucleic acid-binding Zn-ribbon protein
MQKKTIAMMVVVGSAIGLLTGCGIPEEEHNAIIAQMAAEQEAAEDKLNSRIADLESLLKAEKDKVRMTRIELDDTTERIGDLQQKNADATKSLTAEKTKSTNLERELASSKSAAKAAQDQATEVENKYSTLTVEHEELKRRFEQFRKNMSSLNSSVPSSTTTTSGSTSGSTTAPQTDSAKALDLLNQMGNK